LFQRTNVLQGGVPATFQLIGHQTIIRITSVELLPGSSGRVARRLQVALPCRTDFVLVLLLLRLGQRGCLHCSGFYDPQHLTTDLFIHGNSAERDAFRFGLIHPAPNAGIAQHIAIAILSLIAHLPVVLDRPTEQARLAKQTSQERQRLVPHLRRQTSPSRRRRTGKKQILLAEPRDSGA